MSATLHQIDLRLERFERALRDATERPAEQNPAQPGADQQPDAGQSPARPNNGDNQ
jgi:hypothetical protein